MEEEKKIPESAFPNPEDTVRSASEGLEPAPGDAMTAAEAATDEATVTDGAVALPSDVSEVSTPAQEESDPEIALDWSFGEASPAAPSAKPHGTRPFFITFSAIFAVCILLLIATFVLGEGSFEIVRTVFTERTVYVREYDSASGLLTPQEAADKVRQSTVTILVRAEDGTGHGSGFLYSADGYICTNYHVIQGATAVQVMLPNGHTVDATIVGHDALSDLAVLKIADTTGLVPAQLGSSDSLLTGDDVVAVGTPGKIDYAGTATFGKVSFPNRLVAMEDDTGVVRKKMQLIQTDTCVNPGNSGGPLADMYGKIVGIVVMKISTLNGLNFEGIGFAIPIDGAKIIVDAIIKDGSFTGKDHPIAESRSLLGVSGRGLVGGRWYDDPAAETVKESVTEKDGYFQMPFDGIYVIGVNGANAQGKLQAGDILTAINGMRMYTIYNVIDHINRYRVGESVTVTYQRPGISGTYTEHTVEITLIPE